MATKKKSYGYGKRPLWQWILLYVVIGGIVYVLVYYFVLAPKGGNMYGGTTQYQYTPVPQQTVPTTTSAPVPQYRAPGY